MGLQKLEHWGFVFLQCLPHVPNDYHIQSSLVCLYVYVDVKIYMQDIILENHTDLLPS